MQPIRQILFDAPDVVVIPPELRHHCNEVIFWPLDETSIAVPATAESVFNDLRGLLADTDPVELGDFSLGLTGSRLEREEANAR
jgi:hypothetical protein